MSQSYFQPFYNEPGITRDGTAFDAGTYMDGQWVRFYKKKPKKIGGFIEISKNFQEIVRTIDSFTINTVNYLVFGTKEGVKIGRLNESYVVTSLYDITPDGYSSDDKNVWTFDSVFCEQANSTKSGDLPPPDIIPPSYNPTPSPPNPINVSTPYSEPNQPIYPNVTGPFTFLLAHVAPNIENLTNSTPGTLYFWEISEESLANAIKLTPVLDLQSDPSGKTIIQSTGGITVIGSYIFAFGNEGSIRWNNGRNLNCWSITLPNVEGVNNLSGQGGGAVIFGSETFISGLPVRLGSSLGALFWSTTSVILASFVPNQEERNVNFSFSYASTLSTCISQTGISSVEPLFFWVGLNTFYMYNGSVTEVVNETNKLFFFNSLNQSQATKIYSFVNLQYHEWWILFPKGDSLECNHALIYNYEYQCWYDTPLERAAAIRSSSLIPYPLLTSSTKYLDEPYPIYLHEKGVDWQLLDGTQLAIPSSFTALVSKELGPDISTRALVIDKIVFDLIQSKEMTITLYEYGYPRSMPTTTILSFEEKDTMVTLNNKATILGIKFESNIRGGDYLMGKTLIEYVVTGDEREQPF